MNLEKIITMWGADSKIDKTALDETTIRGATLHAKYLELFSIAKLRHKQRELDLAVLKKDMFLYYNGKMTKEDIDDRGWSYDPFGGMAKPLKSDMSLFYDADENHQKLKLEVEYAQGLVDTLKEILDTLRWRSSSIKNIIEFRKFEAGV